MLNNTEIVINKEVYNKTVDALKRAVSWDYRDSDFPKDDELREILADLNNLEIKYKMSDSYLRPKVKEVMAKKRNISFIECMEDVYKDEPQILEAMKRVLKDKGL